VKPFVLTVVLLVVVSATQVACSSPHRQAPPAAAAPVEDLDMAPTDFHNINTMTRVRGFFIDNRLGHLVEALRVANSPTGGIYPVGTIIQLVPFEAMVKRRKGWNPPTQDWEFFSLKVSGAGTAIGVRGTTTVVNQFGGSCFSCHDLAQSQWNLVCEHSHGCAPLPISDVVIAAVQRGDPRPH
jgi:hypothetical protein